MIHEDTAKSWDHLQRLLFNDSWAPEAGEFHSHLVHRGMCNSAWPLQTSLVRKNLVELERHLLRNFRKYAQLPGGRPLSDWDWLVIAQHHGLPTRLLDGTYSPYVGLHFATDLPDWNDQDGVIWSVDFVQLHKLLPSRMSKLMEVEGAAAFTTELLQEATPRPFDTQAEDWALIFEPPSLDDRVVNQYAGMSVTARPDMAFDGYLAELPTVIAQRIVIPSELKPVVRERLDQGGITERVIYPGLDGLSKWLSRYYTTPPRRGVAEKWTDPCSRPEHDSSEQ